MSFRRADEPTNIHSVPNPFATSGIHPSAHLSVHGGQDAYHYVSSCVCEQAVGPRVIRGVNKDDDQGPKYE